MKRPSSLIAVLLATCGVAQAAGDVSRLGKDLNAYGGEVAASKDGQIPAYANEDPYKPGWTQGKNRFDFYKYKDDKVLFVIDGSNVDQHADKLAPALVKLIKTKGYKVPVYPTRRTCRALDFVAANTKKNVAASKIGADGWSLEGAVLPGVAFPMPEKGIEVVWNYLSRYAGAGVSWTNQSSYISPRPGTDAGDGRTDVAVMPAAINQNAAWNICYSTGTAFNCQSIVFWSAGYSSAPDDIPSLYYTVADFDGDGRDDILAKSFDRSTTPYTSIYKLCRSTGSGFACADHSGMHPIFATVGDARFVRRHRHRWPAQGQGHAPIPRYLDRGCQPDAGLPDQRGLECLRCPAGQEEALRPR